MKRWTIRGRIVVGFGAILALMAIMGIVAALDLSRIQEETAQMKSDTLPGWIIASKMQAAWLSNNGAQTEELINQYVPFAQDDAYELGLFNAIKNAQGHQLQKIGPLIQALLNQNISQAQESMQEIAASIAAAKTDILLGFAFAVLLAFALGYFLMRAIALPLSRIIEATNVMRTGDFSKRLKLQRRDEFRTLADDFDRMSDDLTALVIQVQKSGSQIAGSALGISATSKQQQDTANELAARTIEIGATSQEIFATAKELTRTMTVLAAASEHSGELAHAGQTDMLQMEQTMERVTAATGSINVKLALLNEKAGNINQIVAMITKVAAQTNLLSLNAAIEAEKAGEYGRGFSVVATEIRRLADQTGAAMLDIEQTVKEIHAAVSASVMGMEKFGEEVRRGTQEVRQVGARLSHMIEEIQTVGPQHEVVNQGIQVQMTGAEQISQALMQLSEATHQNAESLHQSNQAIEELNQAAFDLRQGISRFKLL